MAVEIGARHFDRPAGLAVVLALLVVSCGGTSTPPTAAPTAGGTGAPTDALPTVGPTEPGATVQPSEGATADPTGPEPLPEPTLTDPADIAAALFDSNLAADGVVSLLRAMGVAIYDADGTLLVSGSDQGSGDLSLTADAVRGLIAMTAEDITQLTDSGGPFPISELHAALAPSLPDGYALEQFAAAYDQAYADNPSSLVAQVMRGQHIDANAGLLRVQMWLLLIDGFVRPDESATGGATAVAARAASAWQDTGPVSLGAGNALGTAAPYQPSVTSPIAGWSDRDWAELLSRLPTLAEDVPFDVQGPRSTHEGHDQPGPREQFTARIGSPADLVGGSGVVLARAAATNKIAELTWASDDEPILYEHGQVAGVLNIPVRTSASGTASIGYEVRQERTTARNHPASEYVNLHAEVDSSELVFAAYDWPNSFPLDEAIIRLATGPTRASGGDFLVEWHTKEAGWLVEIYWSDVYDGTDDQIKFDGFVSADSTIDGVTSMSGTGTATGSRAGWKSCNPGIDVVPMGSGDATFFATQTADRLDVGAFAEGPLAGVSTHVFTFFEPMKPVNRFSEIEPLAPVGDLCPTTHEGLAVIRPFPQ